MGERRGVYRVLVGKPEGKRPLGEPDVDGRIILSWIFRKWDVGAWTGLSWLGRQVVGTCECGNVTFRFHKMRGNFLTSCKLVSFSLLHGVSKYINTKKWREEESRKMNYFYKLHERSKMHKQIIQKYKYQNSIQKY
jgi:hypothetical protein